MKNRKHFFAFAVSIVNSIIVMFILSIAIWGLVASLVQGFKKDFLWVIVFFAVSIGFGTLYAILDGWAMWGVKDDEIYVFRLFRKKKRIRIKDVEQIKTGKIKIFVYDALDECPSYVLKGNGIEISIPKDTESDDLVNEIAVINQIQVHEYK